MASYSAGDYDLMSLKEAELRKRNEEVESRQQAALKRVEELKVCSYIHVITCHDHSNFLLLLFLFFCIVIWLFYVEKPNGSVCEN